jgi:hypothetical protein
MAGNVYSIGSERSNSHVDQRVIMAGRRLAEYDRNQDDSEAILSEIPSGVSSRICLKILIHCRKVARRHFKYASVLKGSHGCSSTDRGGKVYWIDSFSCNMLVSPQKLDRSRAAHQQRNVWSDCSMVKLPTPTGCEMPLEVAALNKLLFIEEDEGNLLARTDVHCAASLKDWLASIPETTPRPPRMACSSF